MWESVTSVLQMRCAQGSTKKRGLMVTKLQKLCQDQVRATMRNKLTFLRLESPCSPLFSAYHRSSMRLCKIITTENFIRQKTNPACHVLSVRTQQRSLSSLFSRKALINRRGHPNFTVNSSRCSLSCWPPTLNGDPKVPERSSSAFHFCKRRAMI